MRQLILLLVLLAAAGALVVLLLDSPDATEGEGLEFEDVTPTTAPLRRGEPTTPTMREVAVVTGEENWNLVTEQDEITPLDGDMRLARRFYGSSDAVDSWKPTGAKVLEIMGRFGREDLEIKFRTQQDLEDFKAGQWPIEVPPQAPIHLLLDTAVEIGFQPILRADAIYMKRVDMPERAR